MSGSRGYVCTDGPLAGTVLMLTDEAEIGSLWIVSDADGLKHVYQFVGDHFAYEPLGPQQDAPGPWP